MRRSPTSGPAGAWRIYTQHVTRSGGPRAVEDADIDHPAGTKHSDYVEHRMRQLAATQIAHECRLGLAAGRHLQSAVAQLTEGSSDGVEVWLAIRGILVS